MGVARSLSSTRFALEGPTGTADEPSRARSLRRVVGSASCAEGSPLAPCNKLGQASHSDETPQCSAACSARQCGGCSRGQHAGVGRPPTTDLQSSSGGGASFEHIVVVVRADRKHRKRKILSAQAVRLWLT